MLLLENIPYNIIDTEVFDLLGDENHQFLSNDIYRTKYLDMKEKAMELVHPRGAFEIFQSQVLPDKWPFKDSTNVALCIMTIGATLENEASRLSDCNQPFESMILDAIGSQVSEDLASSINKIIAGQRTVSGLNHTNRYSPGYCTWHISNQELFFKLLPTDEIGIELTSSLMLSPRKSISFAVNFGPEESMDMSLGSRHCKNCSKNACRYRRAP